MNSDEIISKLRDVHPYDEKYKLHHMTANEIDRLLAESQSRLDGLLSATEANRVSLAKLSQVKKQRDELLNVLIEVDEALYCASEWEVPIMLPTRVKEAIAKAKGE